MYEQGELVKARTGIRPGIGSEYGIIRLAAGVASDADPDTRVPVDFLTGRKAGRSGAVQAWWILRGAHPYEVEDALISEQARKVPADFPRMNG